MNLKEITTAQKYQIVKADYDGISEWYDKEFDGAEEFRTQLGDFISSLPQNAEVLDIGAGTGKEAGILSKVAQVTAIDLSPKMLMILKERYPHISTEEGNMTKLSFANESVDGIWTARAVIHLPVEDLPTAIGEFKRVLKKSANLGVVFLIPEGNNIDEQLLAEPGSPVGEELFYYRNLYPLPFMSSQLIRQGFSVVKQEVFADRDGERVAYLRAVKISH